MFDNHQRYGAVSRLLHWGMALLLLWQFSTALARVLLEDTAIESFMWNSHKATGVLLLTLIVLRIIWALLNLSRRPSSISLMAKLGHLTLYGLMLAIPTLALLRQYGSGRTFEVFGLPLFAGFEGRMESLMAPANLLHGSLGWVLLALTIGHIVMSFWHRRKGGAKDVMPRMWR